MTEKWEERAQHGLIGVFARHPVAPNLLMALMLLAGVWGIIKLNKQLFPDFDFDWVIVNVIWSGASAEDTVQNIAVPLEQELKTLSGQRQLVSRSRQGSATVYIELEDDIDTGIAVDDIKQRVTAIRNLPEDAEEPVVKKIDQYSPVAYLLLTGNASLDELTHLAHRFEQELLAAGIGKIEFSGLPEEEIAIQVSSQRLSELGMTLSDVARIIRNQSQDLPAGSAGRKVGTKQLRSSGKVKSVEGISALPLITDTAGRLLTVGDIATVTRRPQDNQPFITHNGYPAIEIQVLRADSDDTIRSARIMQNWLADIEPTLPPNIEVIPYYQTWRHLWDRLQTLIKNGLSGLVLVIAILFVFLNSRVAFWVTMGIPISFMATLGVLYALGGSLNMISLFGLILALGIIVDDAIVVGEDTLAHRQLGETALHSSLGGAYRMLGPVVASSLTTIAAFLPLMMISGTMGKITFDIPLVIICVIVASLIECFFVLPGHLHHALRKSDGIEEGRFRQKVDAGFAHFRDNIFRPICEKAIHNPWTVISAALVMFIITLALPATGHLKFHLFSTIDSDKIRASVQFTAGTSAEAVDDFMHHLEETLEQTNAEFGGEIVNLAITHHRAYFTFASLAGATSDNGDENAVLTVEVDISNQRDSTNAEFIQAWEEKIRKPSGIERLLISQERGGPPGKDVEILFFGNDIEALKAASLELQSALRAYPGVLNIDDDLPYGEEQWIYSLTPTGKAAGLTLASVGRQLRAAFDGELVQVFNEDYDEVEVRVVLPDEERNYFHRLDTLSLITPSGDTILLANAVHFEARQGIDSIRRANGQLTVKVLADVDAQQSNSNEIIADLEKNVLPALCDKYGLTTGHDGQQKNQEETLGDMKLGMVIGLTLMYIILSWVFASYSWPIAVMSAILLGCTGAILGHYFLASWIDFSFMSMMGLFGLSGIIVNDSIVLVTFYRQLREKGMAVEEAIIEACCQRLRAVFLTSITTVAGLLPILFESSLQAQFLKPMAVSIVFGLTYGTTLILLVVPAMLVVIERTRYRIESMPQRVWAWQGAEGTPITAAPGSQPERTGWYWAGLVALTFYFFAQLGYTFKAAGALGEPGRHWLDLQLLIILWMAPLLWQHLVILWRYATCQHDLPRLLRQLAIRYALLWLVMRIGAVLLPESGSPLASAPVLHDKLMGAAILLFVVLVAIRHATWVRAAFRAPPVR